MQIDWQSGVSLYSIHGKQGRAARQFLAAGVAAISVVLAFGSPAYAGKADDTLVWATASEVGSLDTYYANLRETLMVTYAMCDSLIYRDPQSGKYEGLLATEWKWSDDKTLDLTLRKGVKFHDGKPFGPKDVAYTLNHIASPETPIQVSFLSEWIDKVEVTGENTVRIHAKRPTPAALEYLSGATPIFPDGHYENAPTISGGDGAGKRDFGAVQPMCTGPYKLSEFVPGQTITLKRNTEYFADSPKGQPKISTITFRTIRDPEAQVAELVTGGVDWIWGVPPENADMLGQVPNVTVASAPTMRMSFLSIDAAGRSGKTPLTDVRVRQAIGYAIDRDAIVKNLGGKGAEVLKAMCTPNQNGCPAEVPQYTYDPAKARELLKEAGYEGGLQLPIYAYRDRPFTEAVMNYLRDVGITADLNFLQWGALRPILSSGKAPLAHISNGSNGVQDASASLGYYFDGGEMDYSRDAELTGWLKTADTTTDEAARAALYAKAAARVAEKAYFIPLFVYGRTYAYSSDLDIPLTNDELAHFYRASWK